MVKLILPNSAPPGQGSQKCLENSATELVISRKTRELVTMRSKFITSWSEVVTSRLELITLHKREVTKAVA